MSKDKDRQKDGAEHSGREASPRAGLRAHPRGDCYKLSFDFINDQDAVEVALAHGVPTLRDPATLGSTGVRYGHAWIELGDGAVYDTVARALVDRFVYYREGNIDPSEVVRYSRDEARALVCQHEHYGPWDERFNADDIAYNNKERRTDSCL